MCIGLQPTTTLTQPSTTSSKIGGSTSAAPLTTTFCTFSVFVSLRLPIDTRSSEKWKLDAQNWVACCLYKYTKNIFYLHYFDKSGQSCTPWIILLFWFSFGSLLIIWTLLWKVTPRSSLDPELVCWTHICQTSLASRYKIPIYVWYPFILISCPAGLCVYSLHPRFHHSDAHPTRGWQPQ